MTTPDELMVHRQGAWERLAALVKRAQRGKLRGLQEAELIELGQLYRGAASDLALAQRDFPRHPLARYLNQLVGQAHPLVYRGEPLIVRQLWEFYASGFPNLYRQLAPFIGVAALLFFGSGFLSYLVVLANPDTASYVLSPAAIGAIASGTPWWKELNQFNQMGSALIMTNNLQVSFFAFAGGMLAGLFTVYVLVMNGLSLGMVLGLLQVYGHAAPLWEFIAGHGVLELSEIIMAGGSGLLLGYSILQPGLLSRKDALATAAQKSIRLLLGSAPLLIIAGVIEGFVSPSEIPAPIKYGIGATTGILLYGYVFFAGRPGLWKRIARRVQRLTPYPLS